MWCGAAMAAWPTDRGPHMRARSPRFGAYRRALLTTRQALHLQGTPQPEIGRRTGIRVTRARIAM
jgi:hypothetical protein